MKAEMTSRFYLPTSYRSRWARDMNTGCSQARCLYFLKCFLSGLPLHLYCGTYKSAENWSWALFLLGL